MEILQTFSLWGWVGHRTNPHEQPCVPRQNRETLIFVYAVIKAYVRGVCKINILRGGGKTCIRALGWTFMHLSSFYLPPTIHLTVNVIFL